MKNAQKSHKKRQNLVAPPVKCNRCLAMHPRSLTSQR